MDQMINIFTDFEMNMFISKISEIKGPNKQGIQTRGNEVNTKNQVIQGVRSSMSCYILSELAFIGQSADVFIQT